MDRALFIFRRDLRLVDNTGLSFALNTAREVILCFIFTPQQVKNNLYAGMPCLQFMIESLEELASEVEKKGGRLYLFYGEPQRIVARCIDEMKIEGVFVNKDYTPYSRMRDESIENECRKKKVAFHSLEDALLHPVDQLVKGDGSAYQVFTPFYRRASALKVPALVKFSRANFCDKKISFDQGEKVFQKVLPQRRTQAKGGRSEGLRLLKRAQSLKLYGKEAPFPAKDMTSHLAAHLKFTTCSTREVYHALIKGVGKRSDLVRALHWRDFFTVLAFHFPKVFKGPFYSKYQKLEWSSSRKTFRLWCEGKTGVPIVDAGMRELNETGYLNNRMRMIVASFLVKDLHINWRWGEQYFAQTLIDYDPAVNNGNWQWIASTGADAQPYFRVLNPWAQQKKFDPEGAYLRKWGKETGVEPIVEHGIEAKEAIEAFRRLR